MEGEHCAYIHLSGRQKTCLQLGGELHRSLRVPGYVNVTVHGDGWYSAKFSSQEDYDQAFQTRTWEIPGCNSVYYCKWKPNFNFKKLRPLRDGDIVEGRIKFLPIENYRDDVIVSEIANAVCGPLNCHMFLVESSLDGKLPRFLFVYNGSQLPFQIPIHDGAIVVELSYSLAQQCSNCRGYGHIGSTCQVQVYNNTPQPADPVMMPLIPDDIGAAFLVGPHQEGAPQQARAQKLHEEINSPIRTLAMPAKGAMIVEKGEERKPILYTLSEEVSEINVSVEVAHLKDKNGNQRQVTINPQIGDAPNYTKRVLCTSIDGADAARVLGEMCHEKGASLVVVLDKSSVLVNHGQIGTALGFSDSHRAEMTFRKVEANGSVLYVRGTCLVMWKGEEVRVSVDTEHSSSKHLKFNASWIIGGVATPSVEDSGEEHPYVNSAPSTPTSEHSYPGPAVYDRSPDHGHTDTEGSYAAFGESPPSSPGSDASYLNYQYSDADRSSGDERLQVREEVSDAEEMSCRSSAPSARSEES